jgi:CheY-like chemotaxis protein
VTQAGQGRSVLLVEDSDDVREALLELLELLGHRPEGAATGEAGVARALAARPEVMLVDLGLPDFDGLEVARRVRAALGPDPFLVAMTGYARDEDRDAALAAGFDLHLAKPVDIRILERVVARGRAV